MTKMFAKYLPMLVIAALLLPLLAMAYLGQYSRYIADDYCTTARALSEGVLGSTLWWYNHWAGQFTNWIVKGSAAFLGQGLTALLPTLVLSAGTAVAAWMIYQVAKIIQLPLPRVNAVIGGSLLVFAVFDGTPSLIQSLFWLGAVIPYTTPLIAIMFLVGFMIFTHRRNPKHVPVSAIIVTAGVTFTAGGLSEVYVAFQTTVLALAFVAVLVFAPMSYRRVTLALLGVGIVCSLAALLIIAIAPGNAVRMARFEAIPLIEVIWKTLLTTATFPLIAAGRFSTIPLIVAVLLPLFICYRLEALPPHLRLSPRTVKKLLALSALTAFVLIAACLAPPIQGTGSPPAARAYIIPQFILVSTALFWGSVIGLGARWQQPRLQPIKRQLAGLAVIALAAVGPLASTWQILSNVPAFRTYASEWDSRDRDIRTAVERGERQIVTYILAVDLGSLAALDTIAPDGEKGINECAARYYGVDSLAARSILQMADKSKTSR